MSRFLSQSLAALEPYTPGEQPRDQRFIKLNTNESPFPPSPRVVKALSRAEVLKLNLYSDPTCAVLTRAVAERTGLQSGNVAAGNGSDELLSFAFRAFGDRGVAFADVTYGFYPVWAGAWGLDARIVPLREDFSLAVDDYMDFPGTVFIANPNSPTGMAVPRSEIQRLLDADSDRLVVVDEAYVDFGAESCVPMLFRYDNLLVIQTCSKSRSLAGGRVGFALGCPALIADLNRVRFSENPYNVNRLSLIAGAAAIKDEAYFEACMADLTKTRRYTAEKLEKLGCRVLPSQANFLLAAAPGFTGETLYTALREEGVLVRRFDAPRIRDFCRITVGSMEQMEELLDVLGRILEEA